MQGNAPWLHNMTKMLSAKVIRSQILKERKTNFLRFTNRRTKLQQIECGKNAPLSPLSSKLDELFYLSKYQFLWLSAGKLLEL